MPSRASVLAALLASAAACASAQAVVSTRSGVIHYFEGAVTLSGQPLEARLGKFTSMSDGSLLATEKGRAEVLLTPGTILRVDQNSSIRMLSNSIEDTRVELVSGSVTLDAGEPASGTALKLVQSSREMTFPQAGLYRIDSAPARLLVHEGEAQVADASSASPITVTHGMELPLDASIAQGSEPEPANAPDAFDNWSKGREDSVSADNAIAASIQDPANLDDPSAPDPALVASGLIFPQQPGFTQFPTLGLSPVSPIYSSMYPFQPGFSSLYLPGYTYQPLFLLVSPATVRGRSLYTPYSTTRSGLYGSGLPGAGLIAPRTGATPMTPYSPRPISPLPSYGSRSVAPIVVRPAAPMVVRPAAPMSRPAPVAAPRVGGRR